VHRVCRGLPGQSYTANSRTCAPGDGGRGVSRPSPLDRAELAGSAAIPVFLFPCAGRPVPVHALTPVIDRRAPSCVNRLLNVWHAWPADIAGGAASNSVAFRSSTFEMSETRHSQNDQRAPISRKFCRRGDCSPYYWDRLTATRLPCDTKG
jgi:hypothetical protein